MNHDDLESLCQELEAEFDNIAPMYEDDEIVVYLPLDASGTPEPSDIGERVMKFLRARGLDPSFGLDEQAVVAEY